VVKKKALGCWEFTDTQELRPTQLFSRIVVVAHPWTPGPQSARRHAWLAAARSIDPEEKEEEVLMNRPNPDPERACLSYAGCQKRVSSCCLDTRETVDSGSKFEIHLHGILP
jgi:hypothetical protein